MAVGVPVAADEAGADAHLVSPSRQVGRPSQEIDEVLLVDHIVRGVAVGGDLVLGAGLAPHRRINLAAG